MSKNLVIAIDGPAGSGKSTIAKFLATKIGATYIDTGAMYRAITFKALSGGFIHDIHKIIEFSKSAKIKLTYENGRTRVFVDSEEVTDFIRSSEVNDNVSEVSRIPEVRAELVKIQQKMGQTETVVAEGRDTTTVVFPNADFKIYLVASIDVRAERRLAEYLENGVQISIEEVKENLAKRDKIDSGREVSPLKKADDAYQIDTSSLSINQELEIILDRINKIKISKQIK